MVSGKELDYYGSLPDSKAKEKVGFRENRDMHDVSIHGHRFLELTYVLSGRAEHNLDGTVSEIKTGDYFIVDYGSRHSYKSDNGFDNLDCIFLPEFIDPVLKGGESLQTLLEHYLLHCNFRTLVQNPSHIVFRDESGAVLRLLRRMQGELSEKNPGYREMIRCYLIEILLMTMRKIEVRGGENTTDRISVYISDYVSEHYSEPLTLRELSEKMNYSMPYVSAKFKEETGTTFMSFLQGYRVMQGCRLLCETDKKTDEISEEVGYRDVKFFSRLVKKHTGFSPLALRKTKR